MMPWLKKAMSKVAKRKVFLDIETGDPVDEMIEAIKVTYPSIKSERMGTKRMACSAEGCGDRRIHHERPDTPRGTQYIDVKANHRGPAFCSLNCYFYYKGCMKEKENGNS
jgi:hypothetical protein